MNRVFGWGVPPGRSTSNSVYGNFPPNRNSPSTSLFDPYSHMTSPGGAAGDQPGQLSSAPSAAAVSEAPSDSRLPGKPEIGAPNNNGPPGIPPAIPMPMSTTPKQSPSASKIPPKPSIPPLQQNPTVSHAPKKNVNPPAPINNSPVQDNQNSVQDSYDEEPTVEYLYGAEAEAVMKQIAEAQAKQEQQEREAQARNMMPSPNNGMLPEHPQIYSMSSTPNNARPQAQMTSLPPGPTKTMRQDQINNMSPIPNNGMLQSTRNSMASDSNHEIIEAPRNNAKPAPNGMPSAQFASPNNGQMMSNNRNQRAPQGYMPGQQQPQQRGIGNGRNGVMSDADDMRANPMEGNQGPKKKGDIVTQASTAPIGDVRISQQGQMTDVNNANLMSGDGSHQVPDAQPQLSQLPGLSGDQFPSGNTPGGSVPAQSSGDGIGMAPGSATNYYNNNLNDFKPVPGGGTPLTPANKSGSLTRKPKSITKFVQRYSYEGPPSQMPTPGSQPVQFEPKSPSLPPPIRNRPSRKPKFHLCGKCNKCKALQADPNNPNTVFLNYSSITSDKVGPMGRQMSTTVFNML